MMMKNYINAVVSALPIILALVTSAKSKRTVKHDINWNPAVNKGFQYGEVFYRDVNTNEYMDLFCPQFDSDVTNEDMLKFTIYSVSEKIFNQCSRTQGLKKMLACDSPRVSKKLTIKFQRFSPNPRGFVYHPNRFYYFMGIPHGDIRSNAGPCSTVMRMKIFVHPNRHQDNDRRIPFIPPTTDDIGEDWGRTTAKSPTFLLNDRIRQQMDADKRRVRISSGLDNGNQGSQSKSRIVHTAADAGPGGHAASLHSCGHITIFLLATAILSIIDVLMT